ncbi:hypothetical protein [Reinekea sp. G2M2-21]|uniref:hypothetical protein n=1 Tax=Reinekea sp. G2M2-21 TaxID=2788942 RepID=UPI0018AA3408|nr:hypothetical protein [Reinekea sp. G2M2-21]
MTKKYFVHLTISLGFLMVFLLALLPFSWGSSIKEAFAQHPFIGSIIFVCTLISCLNSAYKEGITQGRIDKARS